MSGQIGMAGDTPLPDAYAAECWMLEHYRGMLPSLVSLPSTKRLAAECEGNLDRILFQAQGVVS